MPRGLSPRVRGNRPDQGVGPTAQGSIPASAGQPPWYISPSYPLAVYPRECGATLVRVPHPALLDGLSPRVRGNLNCTGFRAMPPGSIPASAGQPKPRYSPGGLRWVYPRECGATHSHCDRVGNYGGLSPRVRGNRRTGDVVCERHGSIPASAGQPTQAGDSSGAMTVYPRECGATWSRYDVKKDGSGLSPRVRGNPFQGRVHDAMDRSIPASAGQPRHSRPICGNERVYPRECGATSLILRINVPVGGLSPRVRGNRNGKSIFNHYGRSIPASAGEPSRTTPRATRSTVYPRECGGTVHAQVADDVEAGLSPRVRGNLSIGGTPVITGGSIPASAGASAGGPCAQVGAGPVDGRAVGKLPGCPAGRPGTGPGWREAVG